MTEEEISEAWFNGDVHSLRHEIERLHAANGQLQARLSCMCGDDMDTHSAYEGHSPVSMYDYALDKAEAEIERLREALEYIEQNSAEPEIAGYAGRALEPKP